MQEKRIANSETLFFGGRKRKKAYRKANRAKFFLPADGTRLPIYHNVEKGLKNGYAKGGKGMKKFWGLLLLCCLISLPAAARQEIQVYINGKPLALETGPFMESGCPAGIGGFGRGGVLDSLWG